MKGTEMIVAAFVIVMQVIEKETLDILSVVDTILQVLTFILVLLVLDYARERQARRDEERADKTHQRKMEIEEQRRLFADPDYRREHGNRRTDNPGRVTGGDNDSISNE